MASGHIHRSSTSATRKIDRLTGFAPTLAGRLYAEQLREHLRARSLIGRLRKWIWALVGAVGGLVLDALSGLLTEAAKHFLGW